MAGGGVNEHILEIGIAKHVKLFFIMVARGSRRIFPTGWEQWKGIELLNYSKTFHQVQLKVSGKLRWPIYIPTDYYAHTLSNKERKQTDVMHSQ